MAFEWMEDASQFPAWMKDARDVIIGIVACLVLAVPMLMVKHKAALKAAQGKMD